LENGYVERQAGDGVIILELAFGKYVFRTLNVSMLWSTVRLYDSGIETKYNLLGED
jgi:hypothetical protein